MSSEPSQPRRVGRYLLRGPIASGGMASVHLGRLVGEAGFSRIVAIKRLPPELAAAPEIAESLREEARIVARIQLHRRARRPRSGGRRSPPPPLTPPARPGSARRRSPADPAGSTGAPRRRRPPP
ncbi:uncharacterized protein SOCEGT47_037620 [Sorangium cellulosum]|uniref:Protein kinase domain-containing protein n=1 Tax=Sorangium cellulosum TaxID=56 RepID=A0A4P2Q1X1_SORCE|nr:uncharacterized protein SOCEGT47_037620 [Sorangium cellulosum]